SRDLALWMKNFLIANRRQQQWKWQRRSEHRYFSRRLLDTDQHALSQRNPIVRFPVPFDRNLISRARRDIFVRHHRHAFARELLELGQAQKFGRKRIKRISHEVETYLDYDAILIPLIRF